jgi:thiol-disulfide isomerase/thioredoxin
MSTGQVVLVVAIALALAFGAYRGAVDGRFRGTHRVRGAEEPVAPVETTWEVIAALVSTQAALGQRATLVQFSSAFCAPCRATRRILHDVAEQLPGVEHVEIDAEHHLALVRRVGITRTPTTLVLDGAGHERTRAAGAPTTSQVLQAIAGIA